MVERAEQQKIAERAARGVFVALVVVGAWVSSPRAALAQRGEPELRVCTQNLHRYGEHVSPKQEYHLVERVRFARCDVVGVQEIFGRTDGEAERNLHRLAAAVSERTGRRFSAIVGESKGDLIRNGFLVDEGRASVEEVAHPERFEVPRLSALGPYERFTRLPVGVLLKVSTKGPREGGRAPTKGEGGDFRFVFVVALHFKSKVNGWKDPTRTNFETVRMEMSEAVRLWVERRVAAQGVPPVVVLLGDRNSEESSASAAILRGERELEEFRAQCQVAPEGSFRCREKRGNRAGFVDLLAEEAKRRGDELRSYRYRGRAMQLDDILIDSSSEWMVREESGRTVGALGDFSAASDHKLLWAELNW